MNLRKRALGLALGIIWGLTLFVTTLWAVTRGRGKTLDLLSGYYPGFSVSYGGAVIGLIWGFVTGFIAGVIIAWLYNLFAKNQPKSEAPEK
jgi:ABC-type antimicrobial peptide transport system permease subunit